METWHPRFSYLGFRYVQVETAGFNPEASPPVVVKIAGRFIHDEVAVDGTFTSSSELLNRIHMLIDRAILSNSVSVLTDCPHREKLGWFEQRVWRAHPLCTTTMLRGSTPRWPRTCARLADSGRTGAGHCAGVHDVSRRLPRLAGVGRGGNPESMDGVPVLWRS